ncbi:ATP-binding protein [Pseudomonas sp. 21LCFQ010]|uniref:ATP-binding protein n=1 Tax=unclassified Pseudomonas TaxID=196821 RepID=UPI0004F85147|nr:MULTISPECIES: ATP-binding protein [unclassified Pseudomonas]MCO8163021.1 ATP-binding protein [Pseudomonas sp. 21LCFQ010]BAP41112.1 sensor histidine kinase [Pseudomonas sp. StFLB209]
MIRSLRLRLMLGAATLAVIFMLLMLPALQSAFSLALRGAIEQRLAADVTTMISAARVESGGLMMPSLLPGEQFNLPGSRLHGYIFNRQGQLVWRSLASEGEDLDYRPEYDGLGSKFNRIKTDNGNEFFVYDVEIRLLGGRNAAFSIVAVQPLHGYQETVGQLRKKLYLGFGGALIVLLGLLWLGLTWGLKALKGVSRELDQVEAGERESLSENHPSELLRLTGSLNRLLRSEREQRIRYRDSLGDLAHSLKTPLTVLQGVSETIAKRPQDLEQARVLQTQIERMSQQIGYQLQRASLRKSGLVRHYVALRPVVESLCNTLQKVYRDKTVNVTLHLPERCQVPMEEAALMELLGNLLENAYRLCLGEVRISFMALESGDELCVEDDGPGVPASQRARILQRGERLDRQNPGQGIGLAVVKDIIESYSAQLTLDESPLGGALFRIHFTAE